MPGQAPVDLTRERGTQSEQASYKLCAILSTHLQPVRQDRGGNQLELRHLFVQLGVHLLIKQDEVCSLVLDLSFAPLLPISSCKSAIMARHNQIARRKITVRHETAKRA